MTHKTEDSIKLSIEWGHKFIDEMKPVSTEYQIEKYAKHGYIEYGHNGLNQFIPFDVWKRMKQQQPCNPHKNQTNEMHL